MSDDIDALIDEYGEGTVRKAFWLQEQIYEQGLRGIDFSGEAEDVMKEIGPMLVKKAIEDEFKRSV